MARRTKDLARSFPPIAGPSARRLILGSMPSVASLEAGQYYAHPRNAFWPIMGELFHAGQEIPYEQRCEALIGQGVAVWDVLRECRREGSLDSSIERDTEVANDLPGLLQQNPGIERVLFNGRKAESAFRRHVLGRLGKETLCRVRLVLLPSTSPANARLSFGDKLELWREAVAGS